MKKFLKAVLIFFAGLYLALFFVVMKVTPTKQQIRDIDWDQYTNHYYEMLLTKEERTLYDKLDEACSAILQSDKNIEYTGKYKRVVSVIDCSLSPQQMKDTYRYFKRAHPQYYFIMHSALYSGSKFYLQLLLDDYKSAMTRKEIERDIAACLIRYQNWLKLAGDPSDRRILRITHDLECLQTTYDQELYGRMKNGSVKDSELQESQSIIDVSSGKGICTGYALLYSMVCNANGIDNYLVSNGKHAWNRVKYNGQWLNVDCTWDDSGCGYKYFLITDAQVAAMDQDGLHDSPQI